MGVYSWTKNFEVGRIDKEIERVYHYRKADCMSVQTFYVVPSDQTPDLETFAAIGEKMLPDGQAWIAGQLDGQTFSYAAPVLVNLEQPAAHYNEGEVWRTVLPELAARGYGPDVCSGPVNGPDPYGINLFITHTSIPANGGTPCSSIIGPDGLTSWYAGEGGGWAILPQSVLDYYIPSPLAGDGDNPGWWLQEFLHGATLPHPPECEQDSSTENCALAVMWSGGYAPWPGAILLPEEKATLRKHTAVFDTTFDVPVAPPPPSEPEPDPKPGKPPKGGWGRGGRPR